MGHVQTRNLLAEMKLDEMVTALDRCLNQAEKLSWTGLELLDHLLQAESDWREPEKHGTPSEELKTGSPPES